MDALFMFAANDQAVDGGAGRCGHVAESLRESLRLRYQPIIDLRCQRTESVEVLVRCCAGEGNLAGPERFVEAMTGPDESLELTEMILDRALGEISETSLHESGIGFAINVPLDALLHPRLLAVIEAARARHTVPAAQIRFELTERHPVDDIGRVSAVTDELAQAGYGLALDDVTPLMPHLPALLALRLQAVKIDRSVVVGRKPGAAAFIRELATYGGAGDVKIIAEGIETERQMAAMRALGVTHAQGFLFARPLPAATLRQFLA